MRRRIIPLVVLIVLVHGLTAPTQISMVQGSASAPGSGMPGWPAPRQMIPHHEPGRPSRAAGYTTQAVQTDAMGVQSTVQLTGLDAMTADGIDPLAGNYRAVESAQIMAGANTYAADMVSLVPASIGGALVPDASPGDAAAGDLNGDGIDEQIAAWLDSRGHIKLTVCAMSGQGRFTSSPAAVSHEDGTLDLLVRGMDGSLYHWQSAIEDWDAWRNHAGGNLLSGPAAVSRSGGDFDVFAMGLSNDGDDQVARVYHARWAGGDWDPWDATEVWQVVTSTNPWPVLDHVTPDVELPAPAAAARGEQLDLFRLGPDHTLVHLAFDGSAWDGAWESLGGMLRSAPSAVALDANRVQVFALGVDGAVWSRTQSGESWGPWERLAMPDGVSAESAPTAVSPPGTDAVSVYVSGAFGSLWTNQYVGGGWQGWTPVLGDAHKSIAGQIGGALQLDGVDDYVAADTAADALSAGAFSFGGWVHPDSESGGQEALFGFHEASGTNLDILFYHPDGDQFSFYSEGDGNHQSASTFAPGHWYHVMTVITGTTTYTGTLYVNGSSVETFTTDGWQPAGARFSIGQEWDGAATSDFFAGSVDEVVVVDRALSASEVAGIYSSGWDDVAGKVLGLHLDEPQAGHGTTLTDASGLSNDGTLYTFVPPFEPAPASAVGAAYRDGQIDLFVLTEEGTLQQESGDGWTELQRPACVGRWTGTGEYDRDYGIKVEAGHFAGAGRELIAVSAVAEYNKDLVVALYDVRDGFHPNFLAKEMWDVGFAYSDDKWADGSESGKFDIAIGDPYGEGADSVLVGSIYRNVDPPEPDDDWYYRLERVWCSHATGEGGLIDCSTLESPRQLDHRYLSDAGGEEHMHLAAGDLNGDRGDGWAVVVDHIPEGGKEAYRYVYDNGILLDEIYDSDDGWHYQADVVMGNFVAESTGKPPKDEVVFVSGWQDSKTWMNVYRFRENDGNPELVRIKSWDIFSEDTNRVLLEAADLNRDGREEIVLYSRGFVFGTLRVFGHDWSTGWKTQGLPMISPISALSVGDFLGDSLRVGPPTYRVQERMTTPIMFLNQPPVHRDIVKNDAGEYITVTVLNDASAVYTTWSSSEEKTSTTSNRDWELSTGFEMSVGGGGSTVKTSFDNTYGEGFSEMASQITSTTLTEEITAQAHDQVIYNATTYGVWEYPVLGVPEETKTGPTTVSVVYPLVSRQDQEQNPLTEPPTNREYPKSCDPGFYAPTHQSLNVWSYAPFGTPRFADYAGDYLLKKQTSGGSNTTLSISSAAEEERTASYHNQISAGLEYSYQYELGIPLIGPSFEASFRAYANGTYASENFSTFGSTLAEGSSVMLNFPTSTGSAYQIVAYLYEAEGGYWVLDYQTEPEPDSGDWQKYTKPDPAFILNWYGWPLETDPVDRYPCGREKQLFSHDVVIQPRYAEVGEEVTIAATVRNFSPVAPAGPVTVRFYRGDPALNEVIGVDTLTGLDRTTGPQTASIRWTAAGAGEQKIYAVIDPEDAIEEMHDEDDLIDNNTAYGLLHVAGADYLDPGLREGMPYQAIETALGPGLELTAFVPTVNAAETLRYELVPTPMDSIPTSGGLFRLDAYRGGQADPPPSHALTPVPAVLEVHAPDQDITGLKVYRHTGVDWAEVTCAGFDTLRFPAADLMFVPICDLTFSQGTLLGTFAVSDQKPTSGYNVYLPIVLSNGP